MLEKIFRKKKKKEKSRPRETFLSLSANEVDVKAINFAITKDENGEPQLEVRTVDVCEALHYEHIDFELKTSLKMVRVKAKFKKAINEKRFKVYVFEIEDYNQYFI
ncbi:MAG: hypothetical protein IJE93_05010 [Clostridia bacterium]|nr:hypothetical protein [Clostridia bacterium]